MPLVRTSSVAPNVSISSGSSIVTIVDVNSNLNLKDSVYFNTPISIGNLLLSNGYPIQSVVSTGSYTISASAVATTTVAGSGVLPFFTSTAVGSSFGAATPLITVIQPNNNAIAAPGLQQYFGAATLLGGKTIQGSYNVDSVVDSTSYVIRLEATIGSTSKYMNNGTAQYVYYTTNWSSNTGTLGSAITNSSAWTQDSWGEILLACPYGGPVYSWQPHAGFNSMQVVGQAPFFNGGIFTSQPLQILVCWRSTQSTGSPDNLIVRWSDSGDYTNWEVTGSTTAGSFHIPTGSVIVGGMQAPNFGVIWTDVDAWMMSYVGGDIIFNFTRIGGGCGLLGSHAAGILGGEVYWASYTGLFVLSPQGGIQPLPCTVWDYMFQQLNPAQQNKVVCAPNSAYNEISWFFPANTATENDSYIKYNVVEKAWDYGTFSSTAWVDVNSWGTNGAISGTSSGAIYQMDAGTSTPGSIISTFTTGYFSIADGNELAFIDYIIPDFIWSLYGKSTGQVSVSFSALTYPTDTPVTYGPFTCNATGSLHNYISVRIRARLISMTVSANGASSFWRLGRVRFRYATSGRR